MKEAAKLALLDEYIMTLPQKYNTMIGCELLDSRVYPPSSQWKIHGI